jgi:uncharacterized membrane protein YhhN
MAKQALIEQRPWLLASLAAATAYYFLRDNPVGEGTWGLLLKGAGVGLLAIFVLMRLPHDKRGVDGGLLVLALGLAAAGDMAIELDFLTGGAFFAAAHCASVTLYLRRRDPRTSPQQRLFALTLFIGTPLVSYVLSERLDIALYASFLGAMAATAWMSNYPRYRVGTGAVLFVISDWLIFSRFGAFDLAPLPDLLIWPLYYVGQVMIATGIVQCLRGEQPVR